MCRTYPRGIIETEDGAGIQFEAQGFALRRKDGPTWKVASTVRFVTDHDRYPWLTDDLAIYEGILHELTGTATWSFHSPEQMISAVPPESRGFQGIEGSSLHVTKWCP